MIVCSLFPFVGAFLQSFEAKQSLSIIFILLGLVSCTPYHFQTFRTGLPYPRPKTPPGETSGPPTEEEVQVRKNLLFFQYLHDHGRNQEHFPSEEEVQVC